MITQELIDKVISPSFNKRKEMQKITGHFFNKCFKEIGWIMNHKSETSDFIRKEFCGINKRDIIIFSPDYQKINSMDEVKSKIIFPFDKIFLEYPLQFSMIDYAKNDVISLISDGFYLQSIKNNNGEIIALEVFSILFDYGSNINNIFEEGVEPFFCLLPYDQINNEIIFTDDISSRDKSIIINLVNVLKKICYLFQKKQYDEYFKWTPQGIIKKNIIYSHDVKSHKRHFWKDTGRFKIPFMPKEDIYNLGYGIDECVFRGYELRRDVPYKIIGSYKVGDDDIKKRKQDNRIINLLKKRQFKNEERLGFIISEIFPNEFIKKHDRKIIKPLELDFYIHKFKLAFEYDGEQHYDRNICENVFKSDFDAQRSRDIKKNTICRRKKITLIRVKYDESLNISNIKNKIKSSGVKC